MIPYLGCETARTMLGDFVDAELATEDQVALESHLRWCRSCAAQVEDIQVIGASLRRTERALAAEDARALVSIQSGVLTRIRAEHDQSFPVRLRGMFDDRRLLWPALGATAALALCLVASLSVLQAATAENPQSLAAMIERLDRPSARVLPPSTPGSDQNPLRFDGRVSSPRALDGVSALESITDEEAIFALSAVVTREGRIATYDLLGSEHTDRHSRDDAMEVSAVLDAVKRSRFLPAEAAGGTKVAVNMVWLLVRTTARGTARVDAPQVAPVAPDVVATPGIIGVEPVEPTTESPTPAPPTA
jgi:hypothetical protein